MTWIIFAVIHGAVFSAFAFGFRDLVRRHAATEFVARPVFFGNTVSVRCLLAFPCDAGDFWYLD